MLILSVNDQDKYIFNFLRKINDLILHTSFAINNFNNRYKDFLKLLFTLSK